MNHTHAENFMRSATAPVIRAGVMIANMSWKARNVSGGIDSSKPVGDVAAASRNQARSRFPIHLLSPLKASEYVSAAQITLIRPMQKKFCMSMPSTFLARTIPP